MAVVGFQAPAAAVGAAQHLPDEVFERLPGRFVVAGFGVVGSFEQRRQQTRIVERGVPGVVSHQSQWQRDRLQPPAFDFGRERR